MLAHHIAFTKLIALILHRAFRLAHLIVKETGYKGNITFNPEKPDGTMRKLTDVTKLHELGWHHKIDIEEGVHKMYQWYLEYKKK